MAYSVSEWERVMAIIMGGGPALADLLLEIPADGSGRMGPAAVPNFGSTGMEVPKTGPNGSGNVVAPSGVKSELPLDGNYNRSGEAVSPGDGGPRVMEIPKTGPAASGPRTAAEWAAFGYQMGLGQPGAPVKADILDGPKTVPGFSVGSTGDPSIVGKVGDAHYLRSLSHPETKVTDDGSHGDELAMQDGSFFIQNLGDLRRCIDQVNAMDQGSLDPRGRYSAIKRHIAKRAAAIGFSNMVPANWQLSMAHEELPGNGDSSALVDAKKKKSLPPWLQKKGDDKDGKGDDKDDKDDKKVTKDSLDCEFCLSLVEEHPEALVARDFSAGQRQNLAKTGAAMPNGKFPIENKSDLHNAIVRLHQAKGDKAAVRAHIMARAKALKVSPDMLEHIQHLRIDN